MLTETKIEKLDFSKPKNLVSLNNIKFAHWAVGEGPNLIFIHGWPLHSATFRNIIPLLSKHFTCHLFDYPGAGLSEAPEGYPYGIENIADDFIELFEYMGIDKYGLIAHDSGGAIARIIAAKDRKKVFGMVLGNTETPAEFSLLFGALVILGRFRVGQYIIDAAYRYPLLRNSIIGLKGCFSDLNKTQGDFEKFFIKNWNENRDVRTKHYDYVRGISFASLRAVGSFHSSITAPTMLLWGDEDPYFKVEDAKKMLNEFAGEKEFRTLEGGKLYAHEEYPERFAMEVSRFFFSVCKKSKQKSVCLHSSIMPYWSDNAQEIL